MSIYYHKWLELPISTRIKIASDFNIIKKGATEVFNNQIKSDGYLIKDVETALSLSAIQAYLGTNETDIEILWGYLIDKIEGRIPQTPLKVETIIEPIIKNKRGRPKKNV